MSLSKCALAQVTRTEVVEPIMMIWRCLSGEHLLSILFSRARVEDLNPVTANPSCSRGQRG